METRGKIINEYIRSILPASKEIPILYEGMRYSIDTGGKRVRPILALIATEILSEDYKKSLPYASVIEIIHNFTLVHDDIEDGDKNRRNMPAVWVKFGLDHGINIGDALFAYAFKILAESPYEDKVKSILFKIISNTVFEISEGQALDMSFRGRNDIKEEDYFKMIVKKTGVLLSAALEGGAIIAKANDDIIKMLRVYGRNIGPAFQIKDDLLDLTEGKGRKAIGNDIREGKRSLMVVYCLEKCNTKDKKQMLEILDKGRENVSNEDITFVIDLFQKYNALDYAESVCERLVQNAINAIDNLQESHAKDLLIELAEYIIKRKD